MDDKRQGFFQGSGNPKEHPRKGKKDQYRAPKNEPVKKIIFRDDKNKLRRNLLVDEAKEYAEAMGRGRVSFTQLRSFFNEVLSIKARMENKKYEDVEALIGMLVSKANYRKVRDPKNTELFKFIESGVHSIHSGDDFNDFVLLFEAVVGFFPRKR